MINGLVNIKLKKCILIFFILISVSFTSCFSTAIGTDNQNYAQLEGTSKDNYVKLSEIPDFEGKPYITINNNIPSFTEEDKKTDTFESYSELDELGRCQTAFAKIDKSLMPIEKREGIGQIKPSGWHTVRYDDVIDDKYLYNRCHLIGFQLTGENANEKNLITGTRYLNVEGMLPFENMVAEYIKNTGNNVLYRVTPIYKGENLVASGVQMEAYSIEDEGKGICFNVYCYNNQPGIMIDYKTGDSYKKSSINSENNKSKETGNTEFILNKNTKVYHILTCESITSMKYKNKKYLKSEIIEMNRQGYKPCSKCIK